MEPFGPGIEYLPIMIVALDYPPPNSRITLQDKDFSLLL